MDGLTEITVRQWFEKVLWNAIEKSSADELIELYRQFNEIPTAVIQLEVRKVRQGASETTAETKLTLQYVEVVHTPEQKKQKEPRRNRV